MPGGTTATDPGPLLHAARDFIRRCLVIDQTQRLTAAQALAHPWLAQGAPSTNQPQRPDLLPSLRKNFNAKGTWRRAIMGVRAASALKLGGEHRRATLMAGAGVGEEEQARVREEAERAKRDAEEEAVSRRALSLTHALRPMCRLLVEIRTVEHVTLTEPLVPTGTRRRVGVRLCLQLSRPSFSLSYPPSHTFSSRSSVRSLPRCTTTRL